MPTIAPWCSWSACSEGGARATLPADPDGARDAAIAVRELLASVDPVVAGTCEIAVMEACANVVEHAYRHAGGSFRSSCALSPARFSAAVCDTGPPFDAANLSYALPEETSEGGRGLALLDRCMDRLAWRRVEGENRLLMTRSLAEAP